MAILPDDCLGEIVWRLSDAFDFCHFRLVCKRFRDIADEHHQWYPLSFDTRQWLSDGLSLQIGCNSKPIVIGQHRYSAWQLSLTVPWGDAHPRYTLLPWKSQIEDPSQPIKYTYSDDNRRVVVELSESRDVMAFHRLHKIERSIPQIPPEIIWNMARALVTRFREKIRSYILDRIVSRTSNRILNQLAHEHRCTSERFGELPPDLRKQLKKVDERGDLEDGDAPLVKLLEEELRKLPNLLKIVDEQLNARCYNPYHSDTYHTVKYKVYSEAFG